MPATPDGPVGSPEEKAARETRIVDRRRKVAAMLVLHQSQRAMAASLAVSPATIAGDVKAIRADWRAATLQDFQAHVDEHLAVLDQLQEIVLAEALTRRNGNVRLWTVDRALQIMDRKAALLGLNAPSKVEVALRIEQVVTAMGRALEELGVKEDEAMPVVARHLRALPAASGQ